MNNFACNNWREKKLAKTITMRLEDDIYELIKNAASGNKRSISNFIEYAALAYLSQDIYVSDEELNELLNDKVLMSAIKQAEVEIEQGRYTIVE